MKLIIVFTVVVLCIASGRGARAQPPADTVLVDQRGTNFTLHELRGKPVVLTFVATRCTDACPIAEAVFAQLVRRGVRAQLVTISLDPAYDTPFVISRFARILGAASPQWRIATGVPKAIDKVLAGFGVTRLARDEHSALVYCIDDRGEVAKVLPLSTATAEDVSAWLAVRS
jgi:protein SCO1/2